ncbi:hypothetical protein [Bacteroides pyogenes]|nr:hypothetical protein [Bacteroides pyogenes]
MIRNESHGASVHWSMTREIAFYRSPLPPIRPGISGASGGVGGVQP